MRERGCCNCVRLRENSTNPVDQSSRCSLASFMTIKYRKAQRRSGYEYFTLRRLSNDPDARPRNIPPYIGPLSTAAIEKHCTPRSAINNAFRFFTLKCPRTSGPTWGNTLSLRLFVIWRTLVITLRLRGLNGTE